MEEGGEGRAECTPRIPIGEIGKKPRNPLDASPLPFLPALQLNRKYYSISSNKPNSGDDYESAALPLNAV
jgi:hypothetical protein